MLSLNRRTRRNGSMATPFKHLALRPASARWLLLMLYLLGCILISGVSGQNATVATDPAAADPLLASNSLNVTNNADSNTTAMATTSGSDTGVCVRSGDGDLIGLGVRVGVYLQAIAVLIDMVTAAIIASQGKIVNEETQREADTAVASTSLCTSVALMIAVTVRVAERTISDFVFITANLTLSIQSLTIGVSMNGIAKSKALFLACQVVSAYSVGLQLYFWTVGYKAAQVAGCSVTRMWIFRAFEAYGAFRIFMIVVASAVCVMVLFYMAALLFASDELTEYLTRQPEGYMRWYSLAMTTAMLPVVIAVVEMVVRVNRITGIHEVRSTGQLLALLLGSFPCFMSLVRLGREIIWGDVGSNRVSDDSKA